MSFHKPPISTVGFPGRYFLPKDGGNQHFEDRAGRPESSANRTKVEVAESRMIRPEGGRIIRETQKLGNMCQGPL